MTGVGGIPSTGLSGLHRKLEIGFIKPECRVISCVWVFVVLNSVGFTGPN